MTVQGLTRTNSFFVSRQSPFLKVISEVREDIAYRHAISICCCPHKGTLQQGAEQHFFDVLHSFYHLWVLRAIGIAHGEVQVALMVTCAGDNTTCFVAVIKFHKH